MPLQGHCNCNSITITLQDQPDGSPHPTAYCHCTQCKRQSGASGTYVIIADEELVQITDSQKTQKTWKDTLTDSGTPMDRNFCGNCGNPVTSISPTMPGKIIVKMGLFDEIPKLAVEQYTKNKQNWEPGFGVQSYEKAAPA